jgi:hypothetical protein
MEKLDSLVAGHIEDRLLQPERLEEVLASMLDRRQERTERRREHIAELNKRAAETDLRLKRLYDAPESGVADLNDPALKERIAGLKAIRDQAPADADRAQAIAESVANRRSRPRWSRNSPGPPKSGYASTAAAIGASTFGHWPSAWRSRTKKSALRDRRAIYSEHWPPHLARNRLCPAFAVLF